MPEISSQAKASRLPKPSAGNLSLRIGAMIKTVEAMSAGDWAMTAGYFAMTAQGWAISERIPRIAPKPLGADIPLLGELEGCRNGINLMFYIY